MVKRIAFWWYGNPDNRGKVIVPAVMLAASTLIEYLAYGILLMCIPVVCVVWAVICLVNWLMNMNAKIREWALLGYR